MNIYLVLPCLAAILAGVSSNAIPILPIVTPISHPHYAFNYAVNDPHTGDNKAQWENRDGGAVKGAYSLVEPDGSLRVVEYSADDHKGFNAVVKRIGPNVHATVHHGSAPLLPIKPLVPLAYGWGAAPSAIGLPKAATLGHWSLPWDPLSLSYGGWRPIIGKSLGIGPYATIYSKKYGKDGKLLKKWSTGPIDMHGGSLVIKTKH